MKRRPSGKRCRRQFRTEGALDRHQRTVSHKNSSNATMRVVTSHPQGRNVQKVVTAEIDSTPPSETFWESLAELSLPVPMTTPATVVTAPQTPSSTINTPKYSDPEDAESDQKPTPTPAVMPSLSQPIIEEAVKSLAPAELQALEAAMGVACQEKTAETLVKLMNNLGVKVTEVVPQKNAATQTEACAASDPPPVCVNVAPACSTPPREEVLTPPPKPRKRKEPTQTVARYMSRREYVIPKKRQPLEQRLRDEFGIPPMSPQGQAEEELQQEIGPIPSLDCDIEEGPQLAPPTMAEMQAAAWKPCK
ncbi:unnamed protein product [Owenia fusiformis]|uniref:Uncharacterized protein n=1 Tax=Owenia fusiformis TaxID=6347 RepID=A0A8S4N9C9_OWEFU|nr:unnamed protein product [Owenia fusiformis]